MTTNRRTRTTAEWVVFAIATAIITALAGAIVWLWAQPYEPATVTVQTIGDRRVEGSQTYIPVGVVNHGDKTAEAVEVRAAMRVGERIMAEGAQTLAFLSGGRTERLVFVFDDVPPGAEIELRVAGFKMP
jgi:uncharacterized protein (TIGR02588 family)